jgi:hypothetical protein
VVRKHRSTQRRQTKVGSIEEGKQRDHLREIAAALQSAPHGARQIHFGRWMVHRLLRREGWLVNQKWEHPLSREWAYGMPFKNSDEGNRWLPRHLSISNCSVSEGWSVANEV